MAWLSIGLVVLAIVLLILGTRKLRNLEVELGGAMRGFKDTLPEEL
jgi:sec-independent protein translocase protein TatA